MGKHREQVIKKISYHIIWSADDRNNLQFQTLWTVSDFTKEFYIIIEMLLFLFFLEFL